MAFRRSRVRIPPAPPRKEARTPGRAPGVLRSITCRDGRLQRLIQHTLNSHHRSCEHLPGPDPVPTFRGCSCPCRQRYSPSASGSPNSTVPPLRRLARVGTRAAYEGEVHHIHGLHHRWRSGGDPRHDHRLRVGGWVVQSTSERLGAERVDSALVSALTPICVDRAVDEPERFEELAEITRSFDRRRFVEEAGWATPPDSDDPHRGIATACAAALDVAAQARP